MGVSPTKKMEEDTMINKIIAVAELHGWVVNHFDEDKIIEFYQYSPAGEDYGFAVSYNTVLDIPGNVRCFAENFDVDGHIKMWIEAEANGVSGVPSVRILCDDAEAIADMQDDLAEALENINWEDKNND